MWPADDQNLNKQIEKVITNAINIVEQRQHFK